MSTPPTPLPEKPFWSRFTADPRQRPDLRASDADREAALDAVNQGYSDGRLGADEYDERMQAALQVRTLGEIVPLVADIVVTQSVPLPSRVRQARSGVLRGWLGFALMFNVIWLATWVFSGIGPYYYWPIWPMLGTAIPALVPFFFPDRPRQPPPIAPPAIGAGGQPMSGPYRYPGQYPQPGQDPQRYRPDVRGGQRPEHPDPRGGSH